MSLPPTYVKGFHYDDITKMVYQQMGATHMKVSKLSIGGATLCSNFYGELDFAEAKSTVIEVLKRGINYIDTAPFYGEGKSEENLGEILREVPREAYYIATKTCRYKFKGAGQFDFSYERTMKSIDESLQRLGLDYVDLYQLHDVEFADNIDEVINGAFRACLELKAMSKIKAIGINGYSLKVLLEGLEKADGKMDTVLTYGRYTLFDDSLLEFMPKFNAMKVGVIAASAHGCGMLINRGPPAWHWSSKELKEIVAEAAKVCVANNIELGKLATYHLLQVPGEVATFLIGMEKREYLETNMNAFLHGLTAKEMEIYEFLMRK